MIPEELEKRFEAVVKQATDKKKYLFYETKKEKTERLMKQLGIQKHGKGKRKKKGGRK